MSGFGHFPKEDCLLSMPHSNTILQQLQTLIPLFRDPKLPKMIKIPVLSIQEQERLKTAARPISLRAQIRDK